MRDLIIRNVPEDVIKKINEQYKKKGFKSREEYLRDRLLYISEEEELLKVDKKYSKILEDVLSKIEDNTKVLNEFLKFNCIVVEEELKNRSDEIG